MEIVRTKREIDSEITRLKSMRKKVRKRNNAGDPIKKIIDAEIHYLKYGLWIHKNSWVYGRFSKQNVIDWLTDRTELSMSELWECACN